MFKLLVLKNDSSFDSVTDPVRTEQNIFELVKEHAKDIPEGFSYIGIPLADIINKRGLEAAQAAIDLFENNFPGVQKKYVCQHILVHRLNFYNNIVFTPHTLETDSKKVIPHFNALIAKEDFINPKERTMLYSFFGAFSSHPTRKQLKEYHSNATPVVDTGNWHYYKNKDAQEVFKSDYVHNLCLTKFSLCPEGTGSSTIRLYEAMAAGSIPVLFNNIKVPECVKKYCLFTTIDTFVDDIERALPDFEWNSKKLHEIYWKKLANEHMLQYIMDNV